MVAASLLLAAQPAMADKPRNVDITTSSARGALLFKVRPQPVGQMLVFTRNERSSFLSVGHRIWIKSSERPEGERYVVEMLPPGEYRLNAVHQQQNWVACLEARTLTVTIKAGEFAYLGTLDAGPTLAAIQLNARLNRHMSARSTELHLYRSNVVPPEIAERDPADVAQAQAFVRDAMPKSSAPVNLAHVEWGPFQSSATNRKLNACG